MPNSKKQRSRMQENHSISEHPMDTFNTLTAESFRLFGLVV